MQLIDALLDLCKSEAHPIIAIDGPAGAGKTTLASNIFLALSTQMKVRVIHMDDLYHGWDQALGEKLTESLTTIAESHCAGKSIKYSKFNWSRNTFDEAVEFAASDLIILEGVGSGQSSIRRFLTALIWMDIEVSEGLARVIERDGDFIKDEMQNWLTQQDQHFRVEGTQNEADFILTT